MATIDGNLDYFRWNGCDTLDIAFGVAQGEIVSTWVVRLGSRSSLRRTSRLGG